MHTGTHKHITMTLLMDTHLLTGTYTYAVSETPDGYKYASFISSH